MVECAWLCIDTSDTWKAQRRTPVRSASATTTMNDQENGVATPTSIAAIISGEQIISESELVALSDFVFTEAQKIGELKINFTPEEHHRFWSKVDKSPHPKGCWMWTAGTDDDGYGVYIHRRQKTVATRVAYRSVAGTIYNGRVVCHSCDNPSCVNPAHLSLGTTLDNARDRMERGRHVAIRGESHYAVKLSDAKIREIQTLLSSGTMSQRAIGDRYGVSQTYVGKIKRGARRSYMAVRIEPVMEYYAPKLTPMQIEEVVAEASKGETPQWKIAAKYKISRAYVSYLLMGNHIKEKAAQ
jgi:hypothetical protein